MTQRELAQALGVSISTIKRWESGKTLPDATAIGRIRAYADTRSLSGQCRKYLRDCLSGARQGQLNLPSSQLYSVDRASICQLVDDSHNAVYVCDMETDRLLYVNRKAQALIGKPFRQGQDCTCYRYLYDRSQPCLQCPKEQMVEHDTSDYHLISRISGRHYHVKGRKLDWNGRPAHAEYFFDETHELEEQDGLKNLMDQLGVGICSVWVCDSGAIQLTYMNEGYFSIVRSTREKCTAYAGYGIMHAIWADDREKLHRQALEHSKRQSSFHTRYRVRLDDGTSKELYMQAAFARRAAGKSMFYCTILDLNGDGLPEIGGSEQDER